ncbi:MAG: hypothetical protein JWO08_834 [Verrucomicrobiaceae bacterium]|nr:hypothetical protein [Verrucomicrobiaceae bacterium]
MGAQNRGKQSVQYERPAGCDVNEPNQFLIHPMKFITLRHLVLTLLFITVSTHAADAPPNDTVPLKYIDALMAYEKVKSSYPEISAVVTAIQIGKNTIVLDTSDPRAQEVRQRLTAIDIKPKSMVLSTTIVETDEAHAQNSTLDPLVDKILSRPTAFVEEGKPTVIYSKRGKDGKILKVIVIGRSIAEAESK